MKANREDIELNDSLSDFKYKRLDNLNYDETEESQTALKKRCLYLSIAVLIVLLFVLLYSIMKGRKANSTHQQSDSFEGFLKMQPEAINKHMYNA